MEISTSCIRRIIQTRQVYPAIQPDFPAEIAVPVWAMLRWSQYFMLGSSKRSIFSPKKKKKKLASPDHDTYHL